MKRKLLLVIILVSVTILLTGCGKTTIIGKWTGTDEYGNSIVLTFYEDNSFDYNNSIYTQTGVYKYNSNVLELKLSSYEDDQIFDTTLSKKVLELNKRSKNTMGSATLNK